LVSSPTFPLSLHDALPISHAELGKSDAIMVIAGASDGRHELGARLIEDGVSKRFVVSNPSGASDKVGYAHCNGSSRPTSATEARSEEHTSELQSRFDLVCR